MYVLASLGAPPLLRGRYTIMYTATWSDVASLGAPPLLSGRYGTICIAKGSDVGPGTPGTPWGSACFAWQAWDNVHCQGIRYTPWRPSGLRLFCVTGVGQCAMPMGQMYSLASLGAGPLLRDRHGKLCTTNGSVIRPGVPWGSACFAWQAWDNVRRFYVAGVGQCALPRRSIHGLASLGAPPLLRSRGQYALPMRRIFCMTGMADYPRSEARKAWRFISSAHSTSLLVSLSWLAQTLAHTYYPLTYSFTHAIT